MKKLLSLALVLTMLFTIISVPSVSAATYKETNIAAADFTGLKITDKADDNTTYYFSGFTAEGTDADVSANTGKAGSRLTVNGAATITSDNKTYTSVYTAEATTSTAAGIEDGIGADVPILKFTQTANTNIFRWYFADGAIDAADTANGETIEYRFKLYLTDFYSSSPYLDTTTNEEVPGVQIANPETFSWNLGPMITGGTRKGTNTAVATGKWVDVTVVNNTLTDVLGVCMEGYGSGKKAANYTQIYPGTIYIAAPSIVRVTPVASSNVTVTKIGEGTVTGGGEVATGSTATLTATPDEGYNFAGWYSKSDGKTSTTLLESNDTYSFTVSEDTDVVAVFEKEAVNSWVELVNIPFDDSASPSSINFWTKSSAWTAEGAAASAGNINGTDAYTTYAALEEADISAPEGSHGDKLLVISDDNLDDADKANACGVGTVAGRINQIPGYYTRYTAGEKYRISAWIYVVNTYKGNDTLPFVLRADINNSTSSRPAESCTVEVGKWEKVELEFSLDEGSTLINGSAGLRFDFANIEYSAFIAEDSERDTPKVAYIDSVKIERFEAVEVSAEAENGVVYGTGEYAKGDTVTLNAGPEAGYKFVGYYNKDTDELITAEPSYTFTVTGDTTVVAKFAKRDAAVYDRNVLYHYGSEAGDVGRNNNWFFYDKNNDGSLTTTTADQDSSATYNMEVSYKEAAADGIFVPNDDPTFGDTLYMQKNLDKKLHSTVQGRFRGWENGEIVNDKTITEPTEASGKYVEGKTYRFTWWVYPVSMQCENGETDQPETTKITVRHDDGQNTGKENTFTVNVGEWNMLDWTFTANAKMALYAPGIRYSWAYTSNQTTGLSTVVNWVYYDNIQVSEITEWQFGDTAEPSNAWFRYNDQASLTANTSASNNMNASSVVTYADAGIEPSSDNAGTHVVKMNYKAPNYTEEEFNTDVTEGKVTGDYAGKTYAEAYEHLTRYENAGTAVGMRFKNIVAKNTLGVGETYKISCMIYIDKKVNLATGEADNSNTSVSFIGAASGETLNTDGKNVSFSVPVGKWTEVGYTFKVTEEGLADAQSFYLKLNGLGYKDGAGKLTEVFYVDEVKVERVYVDDLNLEIVEDETNVTATATVYDIKEGNTVNAIVIIAAYDAEGKLVNVALSNNDESKALAIDDTLTATYTKNAEENVANYVAFLWNDLTNIRPYVLPVSLSTEVTE